jgi:hypothetical protein
MSLFDSSTLISPLAGSLVRLPNSPKSTMMGTARRAPHHAATSWKPHRQPRGALASLADGGLRALTPP